MNRARGCHAQLALLRFCWANTFSNWEKQIGTLEFFAALESGTDWCWVPSIVTCCDDSIDSVGEHSRMRLELVSCVKLSNKKQHLIPSSQTVWSSVFKRFFLSLFFNLQLGLDLMEVFSNCQFKYINGQFPSNFSFCQCFPSASGYFSLSLVTNQEELGPLSSLCQAGEASLQKNHFSSTSHPLSGFPPHFPFQPHPLLDTE